MRGIRLAMIAAAVALVGCGACSADSDDPPQGRAAQSSSTAHPATTLADHTYDVSNVSAATFGGGLDVTVAEGEPQMRIDAEPDVYQDLDVSVASGSLVVKRHSPSERSNRKVVVHVGGVHLSKLKASAAVVLSTDNSAFVDRFEVDLDGGVSWDGQLATGDADISAAGGVEVDLSGELDSLRFDGDGGVRLDARDLVVQTIHEVSVTSGSSAVVHAVKRFARAVAHGGASITYRGAAPESTDGDISSSVKPD